jgi:hypothetical protein
VTLDKQSSLLAFTFMTEPRKDSLIKYAHTIGTQVIEINENVFNDVSKEFTWLAQILRGQQLALELSKRLVTNPRCEAAIIMRQIIFSHRYDLSWKCDRTSIVPEVIVGRES